MLISYSKYLLMCSIYTYQIVLYLWSILGIYYLSILMVGTNILSQVC